MSALDVTEKAEIYQALFQLNAAFAQIILQWRTLQRTGLFKSKASKLLGSFAQELQAEFNQELLEPLHDLELNEWNEHGKVRQKWEKYLRGPEPRRRKGHK
jgi:hypothetical protein